MVDCEKEAPEVEYAYIRMVQIRDTGRTLV
jgi:hypothetical protein